MKEYVVTLLHYGGTEFTAVRVCVLAHGFSVNEGGNLIFYTQEGPGSHRTLIAAFAADRWTAVTEASSEKEPPEEEMLSE